jgi:hypothetical protein
MLTSCCSGSFDLSGVPPPLRHNARPVIGLFNESLPAWLKQQDATHGGRMPDVTYLHIDCDLYVGSIQVLTLLGPRIASGAVLIFDDLFNYPEFASHEVKALWEYLRFSGKKLQVLGKMGPVPSSEESVALKPDDLHWALQSAAFIVL